ncbi:hypothetical protein ABT354_32775 [Streptomyces sp. NPDC000594]|uniref:hypothetical protein n=1 Tax=Streptomyces sp. NPDC000594 TaxID=3154261 RepID=UPI003322D577
MAPPTGPPHPFAKGHGAENDFILLPGPDRITVTVGGHTWQALHVDLGNPHAVALVDDLTHPGPVTTPPADAYPHGVTVEFALRRGPRHLALRVH